MYNIFKNVLYVRNELKYFINYYYFMISQLEL